MTKDSELGLDALLGLEYRSLQPEKVAVICKTEHRCHDDEYTTPDASAHSSGLLGLVAGSL